MTTADLKRKLAAILSADVKGYSRLMGEDEEWTVRTLNAHKGVIRNLVGQHRGRVVDAPGDNVLAEFASVVDAVQCAVEIQQVLRAKNALLPETRRMEFRIGINLGDVIEEEDRIYGDGVNIAARLEGLAEPGGICISETAYLQIENKLPLQYDFMGEHEVKNIARPVKAYRALLVPLAPERVEGVGGRVQGKAARRRAQSGWRKPVFVGALAAVFVLIGAAAVWQFAMSPKPPAVEKADPKKMAFPLPDKPSIAVLPFVDMSEDSKQGFFADGMTEEIITALSRSPQLLVVARNSTFVYKGKAVKISQVSEELGVRYVLEGSVQRGGDRIRVTAQLIDALSGYHLWAQRYDRPFKDVLALQDEITIKIMSALHVELKASDHARVLGKGARNLEAYLKAIEARERVFRGTKEDNAVARRLAQEAMALDPEYAVAYSLLAATHMVDVMLGTTKSPRESMARAVELTQKAVSLDESDGKTRALLARLHAMRREYDKGFPEVERALALDPNSPETSYQAGVFLSLAGKPEDAIPLIQKALRLNPFPSVCYFQFLSDALRMAGRHEEAIAVAKQAVQHGPDSVLSHIALAAAFGAAGRDPEARAAAAEVLKIDPKFSLEQYASTVPTRDRSELDRYIEVLRKAGLPDKPPLPLPDKPSIAVLPFVNMSDDPKQEFFSDGLTEEIITALTKTPKLFVIARHSSFVYKGRTVDLKQVGRELGVKYVLEGSVRRERDRLRITAQLIDPTTGNHLWAERYDREMNEVFAIQDGITMEIVKALQVKLTEKEQAAFQAKGTRNLEAYLRYLQAREYLGRFNKEDNARARRQAEEIIALDPEYQGGYHLLGYVELLDVWLGLSASPRDSLMRAIELAKKALAIEDSPLPHRVLATAYLLFRKHDEAIAEARRALDMAPGSADAHGTLGHVLHLSGEPQEAVPVLEKAIRLNPFPSNVYYHNLAAAFLGLDKYDEAIAAARKAVGVSPTDIIARIVLLIACSLSGRDEEARLEASELLKIDPHFSLERYERMSPNKNRERLARSIAAMAKAGLK